MAVDVTFTEDIDRFAPVMLRLGVVPGPPSEPVAGRAYPLAVDVHDRLGAVSFAVLGLRPGEADGWWCVTRQYALRGGTWQDAGGEHAVPTSPRPFEPPQTMAERAPVAWVDRPTDGGHGEWDGEPNRRHVLSGIATAATARLAVTDEGGRTRGIAITPWCGAYVAVVAGATSRLTGYGAAGEELGSVEAPAEPPA